jgi:hypothetical protein
MHSDKYADTLCYCCSQLIKNLLIMISNMPTKFNQNQLNYSRTKIPLTRKRQAYVQLNSQTGVRNTCLTVEPTDHANFLIICYRYSVHFRRFTQYLSISYINLNGLIKVRTANEILHRYFLVTPQNA